MDIYISSTKKDLEPYRARVAEVLRQLGHRVLHMEDYTAQDSRPLERCVEHVRTADLYVGIFAWRYGHMPEAYATDPGVELPDDIVPGTTSITEAEYLAAGPQTGDGKKGIPRLIFLLSEETPWLPSDMDAFTGEGDQGRCIAGFRARLGERHLVSFFTDPENLANAVMSAVQRRDLSDKLDLQSLERFDAGPMLMDLPHAAPHSLQDTALMTISDQIQQMDDETYMIVNIGTGQSWWSTRLYFLASLLVDLTAVRLLVFLDHKGSLFGVTNAVSLRNALARRITAVRDYELALETAGPPDDDVHREIDRRGHFWEQTMHAAGGEETVKSWVRKQELRRYLGDALLERSVAWPPEEDGRTDVLAVVRQVIDWPQDLVPLVRNGKFHAVVERDAMTEEIARVFLKDRARTVTR